MVICRTYLCNGFTIISNTINAIVFLNNFKIGDYENEQLAQDAARQGNFPLFRYPTL